MELNHKRILVIKPSSMGDVIHALPLIHAIKRSYPTCYIGWVVQKGLSGLLEPDPFIDEIITIDIPSTSEPSARTSAYIHAFLATVRSLNILRSKFVAKPYDLVLDLHASFRSGLISIMNPKSFRLGFADAKELNTFFQSDHVRAPSDKPHAVDQLLCFADFLQLSVKPADFRLFLGDRAEQEAKPFVDSSGLAMSDRIVYANPATRWATKFWNKRAWADLADRLIVELQCSVILGGGPSERAYVEQIVNLMKVRPVIAAGRLSPAGAAALIKASQIYVGVDSGPMHMAAFLGTPIVALFGPTDPEKVGPYGGGHRVVRVDDLLCLGCRKSVCKDKKCLDGISSDRVFDEIRRLTGWTPKSEEHH
jgi:heptosyltransferase I